MARTKPQLICSHLEDDVVVEICQADAVYAVLYCGRPIKLRRHKPAVPYLGYKYGKTSFPESGHAVRLAQKLNQAHDTDAFTVVQMPQNRTINLTKTSETS